MKKINVLIILLCLMFLGNNIFGQDSSDLERSYFNLSIFGGIGFSTLHRENINYQIYDSGTASFVSRRTVSKPMFSYNLGISSDIYFNNSKSYGLGFDVSFSRFGFNDEIYNESYRMNYILLVPKLISWQKNNLYLSAGWYFGFLVKATKSATKDRINKFDHGVFVEMGLTTAMKSFLTRFGFKLYLGLKKVFKDWNEEFGRVGTNKGYNFAVHFYTSFIYGIL